MPRVYEKKIRFAGGLRKWHEISGMVQPLESFVDRALKSCGVMFDTHHTNVLRGPENYVVLETCIDEEVGLHPELLKAVTYLSEEERQYLAENIARAHLLNVTKPYPVPNDSPPFSCKWEYIYSWFVKLLKGQIYHLQM